MSVQRRREGEDSVRQHDYSMTAGCGTSDTCVVTF